MSLVCENGILYNVGTIQDSSVDLAVFPTISQISSSCFANASTLGEIYIVSSISSIGDVAFENCLQLSSLTFAPNTRLQTIGEQAFRNNISLHAVVFPSSLTTIGPAGFYGCDNLSTIVFPTGLAMSTIDVQVFANTYGPVSYNSPPYTIDLTSTTITNIRAAAFANRFPLSAILFPRTLRSITGGRKSIEDDTYIENPGGGVGEPMYGGGPIVVTPGAELNGAFARTGLESVVFPSSLSTLGGGGFYNCPNLSTIVFPEGLVMTNLDDYVFGQIESEYTQPYTVDLTKTSIARIGNSAFQNRTSLTTIRFPNTVSSIHTNACISTSLLTVTLPDNLTFLDTNVFPNCPLSSINVASTFQKFALLSTTTIGIDTSVLSTIYTFGYNPNQALNGYSTYNILANPPTSSAQFRQITRSMTNPIQYPTIDVSGWFFPNDLTIITVQAIPCTNGTVVPTGSFTFQKNVYNYLSLEYGESVTFGSNTLYRDRSGSIFMNGAPKSPPFTARTGDQFLELINLGTDSFTPLLTNPVRIEDGILFFEKGYPFTETSIDLTSLSLLYNSTISQIVSECFLNATNLGGIHIVSSISSIGAAAFQSCLHLSTVTFANNSILTTIGAASFINCSTLESVLLPSSLTTIGAASFAACSALESVVFPSSLTTIGTAGFALCSNLRTIVFPKGSQITHLEDSVFAQCVFDIDTQDYTYADESGNPSYAIDLTNAPILRIGENAFRNRTVMATIQLPTTVSSIGSYAFASTLSLSTISLPDSLTFLGDNVFQSDPLISINVTSSFHKFALLSNTTIGIDTSVMSTIYTFGPNPNPGVHGYSTYNILLHPPTDGTQFQQITRSMTNPIQYPSFDLSSFVVNITPLDLSNVAVQAIPCVQGSIVPVESFDFRKGVYNYVPLLQGESITIGTTTLQQGTSGFLVNGVAKSLPCTVQAGEQFLEIVASGSAVLTNLMNIENGILYTTANLSFTEPSIDLTSLSLLYNSTISHISSLCFLDAPNLGGIHIVSSISSIGGSAFENCLQLSSLTFAPNSRLQTIGTAAFMTTHLGSVVFPSSLTTIEPSGFEECRFLSTIVFSPGCLITNLDDGVFDNSDQEDGVSLSYSIDLSQTSITRIGTAAFLARNKMEAIRLPNTLSTIQNSAFASTFTMTTITLPDSVTFLGSNIFSASLSSINVTSSFNHFALFTSTTIGQDTNAMSTIYTFGPNPNPGVHGYSTYNILLDPPTDGTQFQQITRSMTNPIQYPSFDLRSFVVNATSLDLSNVPVQAIPCVQGSIVPVESLDFRKGVYNYVPLLQGESITIGTTTLQQGTSGFLVNGVAKSLPCTVQAGEQFLEIVASGSAVLTNLMNIENGILYTTASLPFTETSIDLANLETTTNSTISHISSYCFSNAFDLCGIHIVSSISSIGKYAFASCLHLSTLTFASNSRLQTIDGGGFSNCSSLGSVRFPSSLTTIGASGFAKCSRLVKIEFPKGSQLTNLDDEVFANTAFNDSTDVPYSINLANTSLLRIGISAFSGRTMLGTVQFPTTLSSIATLAFDNNVSLSTISLPDSLNFLGTTVFRTNPLNSITVTSSFNKFSIISNTTIGIETSVLSTIYTFGQNPNPGVNGYSTYNILLHPPIDQLKNITRSQTSNFTYPMINASTLVPFNPTSIDLTNVTMNAIPCTDGSIIPDSYLNFNANVYNYLSMNVGETITLGGSTFTQASLSSFIINSVMPANEVPIAYTISGHDIELFAGGSGMFRNILPCLLEGTLVRTPNGFKPIEDFKVGDVILSHCDRVKKVLKVGRWDCRFNDTTLEQQMYKIPKGSYGALRDTFVSHYHKVGHEKMMRLPTTLGLQKARESEIAKNGLYTLYHLQVENGRMNNLIVNGNCLVDSWILKE